jgi:hypothetical protein
MRHKDEKTGIVFIDHTYELARPMAENIVSIFTGGQMIKEFFESEIQKRDDLYIAYGEEFTAEVVKQVNAELDGIRDKFPQPFEIGYEPWASESNLYSEVIIQKPDELPMAPGFVIFVRKLDKE